MPAPFHRLHAAAAPGRTPPPGLQVATASSREYACATIRIRVDSARIEYVPAKQLVRRAPAGASRPQRSRSARKLSTAQSGRKKKPRSRIAVMPPRSHGGAAQRRARAGGEPASVRETCRQPRVRTRAPAHAPVITRASGLHGRCRRRCLSPECLHGAGLRRSSCSA